MKGGYAQCGAPTSQGKTWCCFLQLPNFNSLAVISLLAAIMSVSYSTIGWTTAVAGRHEPGTVTIFSSCMLLLFLLLAAGCCTHVALTTPRVACTLPTVCKQGQPFTGSQC